MWNHVWVLILMIVQAISSDVCIPSFLELLACPNGQIGIGPTCLCLQEECRLAYTTKYLPEKSLFDRYIASPARQQCNRLLSSAFSSSLSVSTSRLTSYPLHIAHSECELREFIATQHQKRQYHPCSVSLGKFLRFNSLHLYSQYKKQMPLHDVTYDFNWRWTQNISECNSLNNKWNCAFASLSQSIKRHRKRHEANAYLNSIVQLFSQQDDNHINQVLFYGHLLGLLATPSKRVIEYIQQRVVHTRPDVDTSAVAVSMHIRHGDSCDRVVTSATPTNPRKRHCFAISSYMHALHMLKKKYNVERVYLATDSQAVLDKISTEPDFDWVYVNTSREIFHHQNGWIDYYNASSNEIVTFSAVADLDLMRRGQIFIGAFSSHFSKLAYYLLVGQNWQIMPFISLDVSLSCDTVDACDSSDISSDDRAFGE